MDEQEFRRVLDLFPIVRSRDYHPGSEVSTVSTSRLPTNELSEWQNAWSEEDRRDVEIQGTNHDGVGVEASNRRMAATPTTTMEIFGVDWPDYNNGLTYTDKYGGGGGKSNCSLIDFYSINYNSSAPLQGWLQRIQKGQITVDGQVVTDPHAILRAGSTLAYHRLPWKEPHAPYLLQVLFEDDHLVALNKPSGLQVLPGGLFQQRTVLTQLQWRMEKQTHPHPQLQPVPVPVHRLGRGTSGILLCAKTKLAKVNLAACFAHGTSAVQDKRTNSFEHGPTRKISKIYRALVMGIIEEHQVVIKQPIGLIQYSGVAHGLYVASSSGKPALSIVNVLERNVQANHSLVQVEIQSGRPHQIRIHLAFVGHPLLGDPLYVTGGLPYCFNSESKHDCAHDGGYQRPMKPLPGDCGYHLHAHRMVLHHPSTNEVIDIVAPLPSILETCEEASLR